MKAYQIKIAVKRAKPPVWRRCLIPSGLTFAQLSIVLNAIIGKNIVSSYEFEFYQRGQQLRENDGTKPFRSNWKYDLLDSSETFIDELLEQEEWFTYRNGSSCEFRVTIEAVQSAGNVYPELLKCKGESPEAIAVENLDEMNSELRKKFTVCYDSGGFLSQKEWYERLEKKQYGLSAWADPVNDKSKIKKSADSMMRELAEQISRHIMNTAEKHADPEGKLIYSPKMEHEMCQVMDECEAEIKQAIAKHLNLDEMPDRKNI